MSTRRGKFELVSRLGRGGTGEVFLARDAQQDRPIALKVLAADCGDPEAHALFSKEATLGAVFRHPNLAKVYEYSLDARDAYLAMEFVDGVDLARVVAAVAGEGRGITPAAAVAIAMAAASGLDHAHTRRSQDGRPLGIVHCDVSLANIMLTRDGRVKVIDFGIAMTEREAQAEASIVRGTPRFMAPERCLGEPTDARADVFALGVVLYELVTGTRCFRGGSDTAVMLAILRGDYTPPRVANPAIPADLERVIMTALAVDRAERYASAAAFLAALAPVATAHAWNLDAAIVALVNDLEDAAATPVVAEMTVCATARTCALAA